MAEPPFAETVVGLVVNSQVVVEGPLMCRGAVLHSQATREVRDVCITASTVVHVDHRLGVDGRHVVPGLLLLGDKGSYKKLSNKKGNAQRLINGYLRN